MGERQGFLETTEGNVVHYGYIEKSTEKIDEAVTTIMELDRAIRCGNNTGASVYDDRGILFI